LCIDLICTHISKFECIFDINIRFVYIFDVRIHNYALCVQRGNVCRKFVYIFDINIRFVCIFDYTQIQDVTTTCAYRAATSAIRLN